jgi:predicted thioredoxin/glutaredoxin
LSGASWPARFCSPLHDEKQSFGDVRSAQAPLSDSSISSTLEQRSRKSSITPWALAMGGLLGRVELPTPLLSLLAVVR